MSSIVFILGAGASKQCGAPLMADFLDVAFDLLLSNQVRDSENSFKAVFNAISGLQAVHSKAQLDLNNIESIFTALELGQVIQHVPGLDPSQIEGTISSLKALIVKTLETTIRFPYSEYTLRAPRPYDEFAALVDYLRSGTMRSHNVSVITFNYDLAADLALYLQGLGPSYVIDPHPYDSTYVPLMKLHGSLNWAVDQDSSQIVPLRFSDYFTHYNKRQIEEHGATVMPIGSSLQSYYSRFHHRNVLSEPVIVPPTWNKADYHQALSDLWAAAATHLSEAEYIFIIGYSLPETDAFFRHLYALGSAGKAMLRKVAIFNPDASGETDARFQALLGPGARSRYTYFPNTFGESIGIIKNMFPARS